MSSSTRSMTSRRSSETGSTANGSYPSRVGRPRKHKADIPLLRSRRRARHLPPRFFPRLHPAAGVTGLRATASVEPYADGNFRLLVHELSVPAAWGKCIERETRDWSARKPANTNSFGSKFHYLATGMFWAFAPGAAEGKLCSAVPPYFTRLC